MGATLAVPVALEGRALHAGLPVRVVLLPRDEPGIIFRRRDLPGSPSLPAEVASLAGPDADTARRTCLRHGTASVDTVEHLLAACFGLGITSLAVDVSGPELPIGDGSARLWVDAIGRAGRRSAPDMPLAALPGGLPHPVVVRDAAGRRITVAPAATWSVHFAGVFPDGRRHEARWTPATDFAAELADARTFCRLSEVAELRRAGLIRGGGPENALVWVDLPITNELARQIATWWPGVELVAGPDGLLASQRLRRPDEPARHKLVDLMGDLALLALAPSPRAATVLGPCRVEAVQAGHDLAHRLLREIARAMDGQSGAQGRRRKDW